MLGVTGHHIEEVVDLLRVEHRNFSLALVALHWVELGVRVLKRSQSRAESDDEDFSYQHRPPLALGLLVDWELEPLLGGHAAVDDEHGPVLGLVQGVALAVQAHNTGGDGAGEMVGARWWG